MARLAVSLDRYGVAGDIATCSAAGRTRQLLRSLRGTTRVVAKALTDQTVLPEC